MKYVAYGSNMNIRQMTDRCPTARLIGTGRVRGVRLEFFLHATLLRSSEPTDSVPVAVWEISSEDERRLDAYEGFPRYYRKTTCTVDMGDGRRIDGMIYLMQTFRASPPFKDYYNGIRQAYLDFGLRSEIKRVLVPALKRSQQGSQAG